MATCPQAPKSVHDLLGRLGLRERSQREKGAQTGEGGPEECHGHKLGWNFRGACKVQQSRTSAAGCLRGRLAASSATLNPFPPGCLRGRLVQEQGCTDSESSRLGYSFPPFLSHCSRYAAAGRLARGLLPVGPTGSH
jgi:hypothetical protein